MADDNKQVHQYCKRQFMSKEDKKGLFMALLDAVFMTADGIKQAKNGGNVKL